MFFFNSNTVNAQQCNPLFHEVYSFPVGSEFQYKTTEGGENPFESVTVEYYRIIKN
jgi:hypothetical protein